MAALRARISCSLQLVYPYLQSDAFEFLLPRPLMTRHLYSTADSGLYRPSKCKRKVWVVTPPLTLALPFYFVIGSAYLHASRPVFADVDGLTVPVILTKSKFNLCKLGMNKLLV